MIVAAVRSYGGVVDLRRLAARLLWTAASLAAFLTVLHAAFYLLPGDPIRALFGFRSPGPELIAELREAFGLDDPYPVQLWRYLSGLVTGDLGPVYRVSPNGLSPAGGTVGGLIAEAVPATALLVGLAVLLQVVLGTVVGVLLAGWTGARVLAARTALALLVAAPPFVLASTLRVAAPQVVEHLQLLAGAACLAALPIGSVALVGRPLLRETRRSAFVRRAVASGVSRQRVRWLHALRPALGTTTTLAAAEIGNLLTAAILVEPIIGRPGIGAVLLQAVNARQGPTVLAVVGVCFVLVAAVNLAADVLVERIDPRTAAV
jgi:ABC-type dipeptide/oligopeptide/nickel transport system permease component